MQNSSNIRCCHWIHCWAILVWFTTCTSPLQNPFKHLPPNSFNGYLNIFNHSIGMIPMYYWIYFMLWYGLWHHSLINFYWHLDKHAASIYPGDARIFLRYVANLPEYDVTTHMTISQVLTGMKTSNIILICYVAACTDSDAADNCCVYIHCHCLQLL